MSEYGLRKSERDTDLHIDERIHNIYERIKHGQSIMDDLSTIARNKDHPAVQELFEATGIDKPLETRRLPKLEVAASSQLTFLPSPTLSLYAATTHHPHCLDLLMQPYVGVRRRRAEHGFEAWLFNPEAQVDDINESLRDYRATTPKGATIPIHFRDANTADMNTHLYPDYFHKVTDKALELYIDSPLMFTVGRIRLCENNGPWIGFLVTNHILYHTRIKEEFRGIVE